MPYLGQSQTIADSNVSMAGDMRSQIRQRILAGEKPEHVRKWLVERYGDWVSYAPPVEPLTWPLWAMPVLLLAAGLWLMRGRFKRKTHRSRGQCAAGPSPFTCLSLRALFSSASAGYPARHGHPFLPPCPNRQTVR